MKEKILCIEWEDATYNSGYYDKEKPNDYKPVLTKTVGHLVMRDRRYLVLSQDRFYNKDNKPEDARHLSTIPKKMIKKIIELK